MQIRQIPDPDTVGILSLQEAKDILAQMSHGVQCTPGQFGSLAGLVAAALDVVEARLERRALIHSLINRASVAELTERQAKWLILLLTDPEEREDGHWCLAEDGRQQVQRWMRELRLQMGQQELPLAQPQAEQQRMFDPRPPDVRKAAQGFMESE